MKLLCLNSAQIWVEEAFLYLALKISLWEILLVRAVTCRRASPGWIYLLVATGPAEPPHSGIWPTVQLTSRRGLVPQRTGWPSSCPIPPWPVANINLASPGEPFLEPVGRHFKTPSQDTSVIRLSVCKGLKSNPRSSAANMEILLLKSSESSVLPVWN